MLIKSFKFIFELLIVKVPDEKRAYYRENFEKFLVDVVRAGAEGAGKGIVEGAKNGR